MVSMQTKPSRMSTAPRYALTSAATLPPCTAARVITTPATRQIAQNAVLAGAPSTSPETMKPTTANATSNRPTTAPTAR